MRGSMILTPRGFRGKLENVSFLVVEDERLMQVMIRQMLKDSGAVDVRTAHNGADAFRKLKSAPADVVISDWHMPGMTGVELLQAIKNDPDLFTTLVLIISSEASPLWVLCAVEEGADGYLLKPFTQESLLQAVEEVRLKRPSHGRRKIDEVIRLKLLGHYQEAITLGEQLAGGEDSGELSFELAECHFKSGQYEKAQEHLQAANCEKEGGKGLSLLADIQGAIGNVAESISILEEAVKKNPLGMDLKIRLLNAYSKSGLKNQAQELLDSLHAEKLTDMNLVELAKYYLSVGDLDRALECLKGAKQPLPDAAKVYNSCAATLWNTGKREESIKLYKRAIIISPDYPMSYYNLGLAYCLSEDFSKAKPALKNAIRLKPDYKRAREVLEYVDLKISPRIQQSD
ncbi:MAG: response regulator [Desulforhabdus sp.]|jgi:two-component system chemotaxis response regulator CheY|nr:response regulator [Desulforhabdus sp.]